MIQAHSKGKCTRIIITKYVNVKEALFLVLLLEIFLETPQKHYLWRSEHSQTLATAAISLKSLAMAVDFSLKVQRCSSVLQRKLSLKKVCSRKGGLISQSFSLWSQPPKNVPNHLPGLFLLRLKRSG